MTKYLVPFLLFLTACGAKTNAPQVDGIDEYKKDLYALREKVLSKSWVCKDGYYGVPYSDGRCDDGDAVIFAGLSCLAGGRNCDTVKAAQAINGRWWRSPSKVDQDTPPTFSRDQAKGVMAYLIASGDVGAANRWMGYIQSIDSRLCPENSHLTSHCLLTPANWALLGDVWSYIGLKPTINMRIAGGTIPRPDDLALSVEARNNVGFRLHLAALTVWFKQLTGRPTQISQKSAKVIYSRQPNNPFYAYLAGDYIRSAQLTLSKCANSPSGTRRQWAWQRDESESAWKDSQGWDCVFMIDLLLEDRK